MDDDLHKRLKDRLTAPPPPALDRARSFLLHYVHDSDPELLDRDLRGLMQINPRIIIDAVVAIEELLSKPPTDGTLYSIVTHEGNEMLHEETDDAAATWLRGLVAQLRRQLGDLSPPIAQG